MELGLQQISDVFKATTTTTTTTMTFYCGTSSDFRDFLSHTIPTHSTFIRPPHPHIHSLTLLQPCALDTKTGTKPEKEEEDDDFFFYIFQFKFSLSHTLSLSLSFEFLQFNVQSSKALTIQ